MLTTETQRLKLRQVTMEDLPRLYKLFSDPRVMLYTPSGIMDQSKTIDFIKRNLSAYADGSNLGIMGIVYKNHQKLIGIAGCYYQDIDGPLEIEIAYKIQPNYWGQGLATEAVIAVKDYIFNTLHKNRIVAAIHVENIPSIKLAERIGMIRERESVYLGMPIYMYAVENK